MGKKIKFDLDNSWQGRILNAWNILGVINWFNWTSRGLNLKKEYGFSLEECEQIEKKINEDILYKKMFILKWKTKNQLVITKSKDADKLYYEKE